MAVFAIWHSAWAPPSVGLLLIFIYIRQEGVAKIPKLAGAPRNVNPAQE